MTETRFSLLISLLAGASAAHAEVTPSCLFQDHMILQESAKVPVWGKAAPAEPVKVTVAGVSGETKADSEGNWQVMLDLHDKRGGPYELVAEGRNRITFSDVLVGEVWLASGQSNMELSLAESANAKDEISDSANERLRQFKIQKSGALTPIKTCNGKWVSAAPDTAGRFTAVGYYFGKELQQKLNVPVGIISSNYGGSGIEAWLSPDAINSLPEIKPLADPIIEEARTYADRQSRYLAQYEAWQAIYHREDIAKQQRTAFVDTDIDASDWRPVKIKTDYKETSLKDGGVLWLRKRLNVTPEMAGSNLVLHLGTIHEFDEVFWDGVSVGSTTADASTLIADQSRGTTDRRYDVPGRMVKAGTSVLAIRIFNPVGAPSITKPSGSGAFDPLLSGYWLAKTEWPEGPLDVVAKTEFPVRPDTPAAERTIPSNLFNAMISPLMPYAIRGVIWFQGEANVGRSYQYRSLFPAMIEDWRKQWGEGNFPFYFCQLANLQAKDTQPHESALAELREAQTMALRLPQTGQAVTLDLGEEEDVHFRDKKTVGLRLSRIALANTYSESLAYSGPVYEKSEHEGSGMRIHFRFTEGGLKSVAIPATYKHKSTLAESVPLVRNSPGSELEGFQICGADHKWKWADAKIEGNTVFVSSKDVTDAMAVRYAWGNNPTVNLYNAADLPALPFRTDDFPTITRNARF